jgi:hypothetical protein
MKEEGKPDLLMPCMQTAGDPSTHLHVLATPGSVCL